MFIQLQLACGSSGTRNRHPAAWATVLDGALARRHVEVIVALVEHGLDLRCRLVRGGPPLDTLLRRRFDEAAFERIQEAANTSGAAEVTERVRGCGLEESAAASAPVASAGGAVSAGLMERQPSPESPRPVPQPAPERRTRGRPR